MRIKLKGTEVDLQMQQYEIGLYVCIYNLDGTMKEQFGLDCTKDEFMKDLYTNPDVTFM